MKTKIKISAAAMRLLGEAYRRNQMFITNRDTHELSKPLVQRWLGLGTASAYKAAIEEGLMTWACNPPSPRCMGWLKLTPLGLQAFEQESDVLKENYEFLARNHDYQRSVYSQYQLAGGLIR